MCDVTSISPVRQKVGLRLPVPISANQAQDWLHTLRAREPELRRSLERQGLRSRAYFDFGYAAAPGVVTGRIALRVHLEAVKTELAARRWLEVRGGRLRLFVHEWPVAKRRKQSKGFLALVDDNQMLHGGMQTKQIRDDGSEPKATIGAVVLDRASGAIMALSCSHSWEEPFNVARSGIIGRVSRSALDLDAAVVRIRPGMLSDRGHAFEIPKIPGGLHGMVEPRLGVRVVKTGQRTNTTYGYIEGISTEGFTVARMPGERGELTLDGDSGSVWVEVESGAAVGVHYGGELYRRERECSYAHRMTDIARRLKIEVSRRRTWTGQTSVGPGFSVWKKNVVLAATVGSDGRLAVKVHGRRRRRTPGARRRISAPSLDCSVAMIELPRRLVMAYVDRRTRQIHLTTSRNGGSTWSAAGSLGERTFSAPALAAVGSRVALAWRDASTNRIRIAISTDLRHWSASEALPFATKSGPALAALGSRLVVAWRDAKNDAIKVVKGSRSRIRHERPTRLRFKTRARPALQVHAGCLYLAWTSLETRRLQLASSHDGKDWSDSPLALHDTAIDGPALASQGHDLIWAWTDSQGRVTSLRTERRPHERK